MPWQAASGSIGSDRSGSDSSWKWRNENDDGNTRRRRSYAKEEDERVGTQLSFEEILARELQKAEQHDGGSLQQKTTNTLRSGNDIGENKATVGQQKKKSFLKKGARGWWMQRPDVHEKLSKHTLESKDLDEMDNQVKSTKKSIRKQTSSQSRPLSRSKEELYHDLSPRSPSTQQNRLDIRQTLGRTDSPTRRRLVYSDNNVQRESDNNAVKWGNESIRTNVSLETLGMSRVRQSYEAKLEREADELAEFEAIEKELAAEKDSYLKEKRQAAEEEIMTTPSSEPSPLWDLSGITPYGFHHVQPPTLSPDKYDIHDDNLDAEAHSSLVYGDQPSFLRYEEEHKMDETSYQSQLNDHFGSGRRVSYPVSELSAISFNDSEPWYDQLTFQQRESLSSVATSHRRSNILNSGADKLSNDLESYEMKRSSSWNEQAAPDIGDHLSEHSRQTEDDFSSRRDESAWPPSRFYDDAPVSLLVQQVFGNQGSTRSEEDAEVLNEIDELVVPDSNSSYDSASDKSTSVRNTRSGNQRALSTLKQKLQGKQNPNVDTVGNQRRSPGAANTAKRQGRGTTKSSMPPRPPARGKTASATVNNNQRDNRISTQVTRGSPILPIVVEEKLMELEEEVKFYKAETLQLQKRKEYYEQEVKKLAKEREDFARYQQEQRLLIEKEWGTERAKMKKEQKLMDRQWKLRMNATASHQDRKERAEIEALKAQIVKMQLDEKMRADKWKATNDTLRQRLAELEVKNQELSEEIKFLEKDRLEQWEKYEQLLKEKQKDQLKPALTTDTAGTGGSRWSNGEMKTVNDLFAIKDTAEELLKGWKFPNENSKADREVTNYPSASSGFYSHSHTVASSEDYNPERYQIEKTTSDVIDTLHHSGNENVQRKHHSFSAKDDASSDHNFYRVENGENDTDATVNNSSADQRHTNHKNDTDDIAQRSSLSLPERKSVEREILHPGGKRETIYTDGSKRIVFADGNEKEIEPNGNTIIKFTNGDRKELFPDTGISIYYYFEAQTKLTTYPDKVKVYEFPNQQIEKSYPDGTTEITFADGIEKTIRPNGDEFSIFPDGTTMLEQKDGLREVTLLNQKRIRYYPDGQMAWITPNGKETQVRSDAELRKLMESL